MGKEAAKRDDSESRFTKIEELISDLKSTLTDRSNELDQKLQKVIDSQSFLSQQYDNFRKVMDNIMKDNVDLRKENVILTKRASVMETEITQARNEINDLEQYGRRSMLEIAGIPRSSKEDAEEIVLDLCKSMNVKVKPEDIEACHRISPRDTASIIVKFCTRKTRDKVMAQRNTLKGKKTHDLNLVLESKSAYVYINESLTKKNKEIFSATLNFKKENHYKYIWTRNGTIYIRKSDNCKALRIRNNLDLEKIGKLPEDQLNQKESPTT